MLERAVAENCFEVEPGLYRILLPLPWQVPFVNAWLVQDQGEWALVDCGLNHGPSLRALGRALKGAGVPPRGLKHLILTHRHTDHAAAAGPVQERWGGQAWLHPRDLARAPLAAERIQAWLHRHGVAGDLLAAAGARRGPPLEQLPAQVEPLPGGHELAVGALRLQVLAAPGHSPGQVMLLEPGRGWLFSADQVLPMPAWDVWFDAWAPGDPLGDYLAALDRAAAVDCRLVLPGHGLPFAAPKLPRTCGALARVHRRRAAAFGALLGADELTAHALAGRESPALAADPGTVGQAIAETMAALVYLAGTGAVAASERDGMVYWRRTGGAADTEEAAHV